MTSAAEAEIGAMYINAREAVPQRMTLSEMVHPQPRTPMQTDNLSAHAVVTNNVQPRRTKAMYMGFHWLRRRDAQGQFRYYWKPGTMNLGDYWTKHHPSAHHKKLPVLSVKTNEEPNGFLSQTYGIDRKIESTKEDTVYQHESIKDDQKNVGTNNGRFEYRTATPQQGCARLGNRTFPKNGKHRACKIPNIYGAVDNMPITLYVRYRAQYVCKTDYIGHRTYGTYPNTDKCQTDYIVR